MSDSHGTPAPFPVVRASDIAVDDSRPRWLIEGLWGSAAVGLLCGHPKVGKSWLGLELATSVASGTPCLARFPVHTPGPALVYLAEDSLVQVRERLACLARHRELELAALDLHVITAPRLRLDLTSDRARLLETVRAIQPRLLLLDPLVRLHALDENDAQAMSALLGSLRDLERQCHLAIAIVHHARKAPAAHDGQALRGSGDLWAFADSALYLRRQRDRLRLSMEHRAAPAPAPIHLRLVDADPHTVHLEVDPDPGTHHSDTLEDAVLRALAPGEALHRADLRRKLQIQNERLGRVLVELESRGTIQRGPQGWTLVCQSSHDGTTFRSAL
jgi:hypothetical protein